jgi:hypothetical protein
MQLYVFLDDSVTPYEWRVDAIDVDGDGSMEISTFSGPNAEERARGYAALRHPGVPILPTPCWEQDREEEDETSPAES